MFMGQKSISSPSLWCRELLYWRLLFAPCNSKVDDDKRDFFIAAVLIPTCWPRLGIARGSFPCEAAGARSPAA
jgi:hypothetical protein